MPGAVPRTATQALTNVTLPYVVRLADEGAEAAMSADRHLRAGLSVRNGQLVDETVARALEGCVADRLNGDAQGHQVAGASRIEPRDVTETGEPVGHRVHVQVQPRCRVLHGHVGLEERGHGLDQVGRVEEDIPQPLAEPIGDVRRLPYQDVEEHVVEVDDAWGVVHVERRHGPPTGPAPVDQVGGLRPESDPRTDVLVRRCQ